MTRLWRHELLIDVVACIDLHPDLLKEVKRTVESMLDAAAGEYIAYAQENEPCPFWLRQSTSPTLMSIQRPLNSYEHVSETATHFRVRSVLTRMLDTPCPSAESSDTETS